MDVPLDGLRPGAVGGDLSPIPCAASGLGAGDGAGVGAGLGAAVHSLPQSAAEALGRGHGRVPPQLEGATRIQEYKVAVVLS